jgi:hypothetical protein
MRLIVVAIVVVVLVAACETIDSSDEPTAASTTTTERLEVLGETVTTQPRVTPREETPGSGVLKVALRVTATTTTSSTTTTSTTTTTNPKTPLVPFPDVPPLSVFEAAEDKAVHVVSDPYTIDPEVCEGVVWTFAGTDWSAFLIAAPTADGFCEIWLGGQTDNPDYTGYPYLYCVLPKDHDPVVIASDANSDWVTEPGLCAPTGFDQG